MIALKINYGNNSSFLFNANESLMWEIKTEDVYEATSKDK